MKEQDMCSLKSTIEKNLFAEIRSLIIRTRRSWLFMFIFYYCLRVVINNDSK